MAALDRAGVATEISTAAVEVPDPIDFPSDVVHASYEPEWARRFHRALVEIDAVLKEHRARFRGKTSPVQFFWGSFDLAYTRYSGKLLEPDPTAGTILRYTHDAEQACAGFWPGDAGAPEPIFFAYTWPQPDGIDGELRWNGTLGELVLPYSDVCAAADPRHELLDFLESAYRAGAGRARWPQEVAP